MLRVLNEVKNDYYINYKPQLLQRPDKKKQLKKSTIFFLLN